MNIEKFCRFCLKEMNDTHFEDVEETVRNMSNILKLKMNLDISKQPVICVNCIDDLKKLYNFKVICIETENHISSFINPQLPVETDLHKIYLKVNGNKNLDGSNICRFCICGISSDLSIHLNAVIEATLPLKNLLEVFLPEIDLALVRDPIICKTCHNFLQDYLTFTRKCRNVEEIITKYIETEVIRPGEKIDLKNVQQLSNKVVIKEEIDQIDVVIQEMQQSNHQFLEDLSFNLNIKSESCLPTEELNIKCENVDLNLMIKDAESAQSSISLLENVKKEEVDDFNKINNTEQICKSPVPYSCSGCKLEVECNRDKDLLHENQFPIMEGNKCCKHETKRKCYSQRNLPKCNSSSKKERLADDALDDLMTYKCENEDCSYKTRHKGNLTTHTLTHKGALKVEVYKCGSENCSFETKYKSNLKKHVLVHKDLSEVATYKCENENCSFETKRKYHLTRHKILHRYTSEMMGYKCEHKDCPFVTLRKGNLAEHSVVHKDPSELTMYKCGYDGCSFETKHKNNVSKHELVHKNLSEVEVYMCGNEGCSYETKYKRNLISHQLIHKDLLEVKVYKCQNEACTYETKYKSSLKTHKLIHKDPSEVITYKCGEEGCSYESKRKGDLSRHKLMHNDPIDITIYKCTNEYCSYETKCKRNLIMHELLHKDSSKIMMYNCEYEACLYQTKYKGNLIKHKKIHGDTSALAIYKCDNEGCTYQTKHKGYLNNHRLIHKDLSEVTVYKCANEGCLYETKYKGNLVSHTRVHKALSEVTLYKCRNEDCSYETKFKRSLTMHHKLLHNDS